MSVCCTCMGTLAKRAGEWRHASGVWHVLLDRDHTPKPMRGEW